MAGARSVLVVGAGPVGLVAALELVRRGVGVRIVEREPARGAFSKALLVNARTLALLDAARVTPRIVEAGRRIDGGRIARSGRIVAVLDFGRLPPPWSFGVVLPQSRTEAILEARLAELGVAVERGVRWIGCEQGACVRSRIARADGAEEEVATDLLVAADGAHSDVRHALGLRFDGDRLEREWHLADVRADLAYDASLPFVDFRPDGVFLTIAIEPGLFRIVSSTARAQERLGPESAVHELVWESSFAIHHRQVSRYAVDRVFLAGDAAHVHSPLGGRGMNLGIADAAALAELVEHGEERRYDGLRRPVGARVVRAVRRLTRIAAGSGAGERLARDAVLPLALQSGGVRRAIARRILDPP